MASRDAEQLEKFQILTQRFYTQLTIGCHDNSCESRFCRKADAVGAFTPATAKILALQLAASPQPSKFLCTHSGVIAPIIMQNSTRNHHYPVIEHAGVFVQKLFSTKALAPLVNAGEAVKKSASTMSLNTYSFQSYDDLIAALSNSDEEEELGRQLKQVFSSVHALVRCFRSTDFKLELRNAMELIQSRELLQKNALDGIMILLRKLAVFVGAWTVNYQFTQRYIKPYLQDIQNAHSRTSTINEANSISLDESTNIFFALIVISETSFFEISNTVFTAWTNVVGNMNASTEECFVDFIHEHYVKDIQGFARIVRILKHNLKALSILLASHTSNRPDITCLRCLNIFFKANEIRGSELHPSHHEVITDRDMTLTKIPFSHFYATGDADALNTADDATSSPSPEEPYLNNLDLKDMYLKYLNGNSTTLLNYPFVIDVITKVKLLKLEALVRMHYNIEYAMVKQGLVDQLSLFSSNINELRESDDLLRSPVEDLIKYMKVKSQNVTNPYCLLEVSRSTVLDDTFLQLNKKSLDFNKPLKVRFKGEEGLDQGGVQKELFQTIFEHIIDPDNGFFVYDDDIRLCWLNSNSDRPTWQFQIIGILLGLAAYNSIIIDLPVPLVFFKKLIFEGDAGFQVGLDDLHQLDPTIYDGFKKLLEWDTANGRVVDVFCQSFEITFKNKDGSHETVPLCANGSEILVDETNRHRFVSCYLQEKLVNRLAHVFAPLQKGFLRVMDGDNKERFPTLLQIFRPEELKIVLTGMDTSDKSYSAEEFGKLKASASYNGYEDDSQTIIAFWNVLQNEFCNNQRKKFLGFLTASDRIPVGGLIKMKLIIQKNGTAESNRLPTSYTCFNTLLLPDYQNHEKLLLLLSKAIEEGKGFGLV